MSLRIESLGRGVASPVAARFERALSEAASRRGEAAREGSWSSREREGAGREGRGRDSAALRGWGAPGGGRADHPPTVRPFDRTIQHPGRSPGDERP